MKLSALIIVFALVLGGCGGNSALPGAPQITADTALSGKEPTKEDWQALRAMAPAPETYFED